MKLTDYLKKVQEYKKNHKIKSSFNTPIVSTHFGTPSTYDQYKTGVIGFTTVTPAKNVLDQVYMNLLSSGVDEDIIRRKNGVLYLPKAALFVTSLFNDEKREIVPMEDLMLVIETITHKRFFSFKNDGDNAVSLAINYFKFVGGVE